MTSKHLFFKCMKEDLRHRIWMIALSVLDNFLALPIAYLIAFDKVYYNLEFPITDAVSNTIYTGRILNFFKEYVTVFGGTIAISSALIVGLCGFRYVFHKNMVDTWHSLPVKRSTLFGACYLNGFLIWFVPFLLNMILAMCLSAGELYRRGGMEAIEALLRKSLVSSCALTVSFLLIYNLILVAVMLSGNILNTLVSLGILGFGAISVYGMFYAFLEHYMDTFYATGISVETVIYASPLVSAVVVLYNRYNLSEISAFIPGLVINLAVAVIMGAAAWYLYKKRASELAEQGLKNRIAALLMKVVCSIIAGMAGWMIFVLITGRELSVIWGIFGNVLSSVLCFGILDIIFSMDFKAFWGHKLCMLLTVGIAVLLCFSFWGDWYGYDGYLPKQTELSQMALYCGDYSNRHENLYEEKPPLKNMQLQDTQLIYNFLETAVEHTLSETAPENPGRGNDYDRFSVRVTLKGGKTYERQYKIYAHDEAVVLPLLTQKEYTDAVYKISEEDIARCAYVVLNTGSGESRTREECDDNEVFRAICEAYNKDLEENAKAVILGEGRMLAQLQLDLRERPGFIFIDVCEGMKHTVKALQDAGYEEYTRPADASEVSCIKLRIGGYYDENTAAHELVEAAGEHYGVYTEESAKPDTDTPTEANVITGEAYAPSVKEYHREAAKALTVQITAPEEIEELLKLLHYSSPAHDYSVLRKNYIKGIYIVDKYGVEQSVYIKEGELPEKYIQKFGKLGK